MERCGGRRPPGRRRGAPSGSPRWWSARRCSWSRRRGSGPGCSRRTSRPTSTRPATPGWVRRDALAEDDPLEVARGFLGTPYVWGGLGHDGIDCSGGHLSFRAVGVRVPRDAADQAAAAPGRASAAGRPLLLRPARRGAQPRRFVTEVGLLHASHGVGVVEQPMPEERRATLLGAGRLPYDDRQWRRLAPGRRPAGTSTRRSGWSWASCDLPYLPRCPAAARPRR